MKPPHALTVLWVALCSYLLIGACSLTEADFGKCHDEGIYAVTAKCLAETGEYRITSLPPEPVQHKYPVGFPAILSLVWRIAPGFPGNILVMKSVSLIAGALFLIFAYGLLRTVPDVSPSTAVACVSICAVAPGIWELANGVMSELPYGAFSLAALWLLERRLQRMSGSWLGVASGLLAAAAWLTRSVGVALLVAIVVGLAWRRNWRLLGQTILGMLLLAIPVKLWEAPPSHVDPVYEYYVGYGDWFQHAAVDIGWRSVWWVPLKNLGITFGALAGTLLPTRLDFLPGGSLQEVLLLGLLFAGMFGLLLAAVGIQGRVWSRTPPIWTLYLCVYLLVILYWPFPPTPRFFIPVLPLLLLACRDGMLRTGCFRSPVIRRALAATGVLTLLLLSGFSAVGQIGAARLPNRTQHYDWIREHSQPGDVIASTDDPKCFLYTGRKAILCAIPDVVPIYGSQGRFTVAPDNILKVLSASQATLFLKQISAAPNILVEMANDSLQDPRIQEVLEEQWRDEVSGAVIYRIRRDRLSALTPP